MIGVEPGTVGEGGMRAAILDEAAGLDRTYRPGMTIERWVDEVRDDVLDLVAEQTFPSWRGGFVKRGQQWQPQPKGYIDEHDLWGAFTRGE